MPLGIPDWAMTQARSIQNMPNMLGRQRTFSYNGQPFNPSQQQPMSQPQLNYAARNAPPKGTVFGQQSPSARPAAKPTVNKYPLAPTPAALPAQTVPSWTDLISQLDQMAGGMPIPGNFGNLPNSMGTGDGLVSGSRGPAGTIGRPHGGSFESPMIDKWSYAPPQQVAGIPYELWMQMQNQQAPDFRQQLMGAMPQQQQQSGPMIGTNQYPVGWTPPTRAQQQPMSDDYFGLGQMAPLDIYGGGGGLPQAPPLSQMPELNFPSPMQFPSSPQMTSPGTGSAPASAGTAGPSFNITPSITPSDIYSPQKTRESQNDAWAQANQTTMPWLLDQMRRPGISSRSPSMLAGALPQFAQAQLGGRQQMAGIGLQDAMANAQQRLAGETGREEESMAIADMMRRILEAQRGFGTSNFQNIIGMLGGF